MSDTGIHLYEWPPTRSQRAKWLLEELGINYTNHLVDMGAEQQKSAEYRAVHPSGLVPAHGTPRYTMFESVAIVLQLCDEHSQAHLAPAINSPRRGTYYQWNVFACAELDPAIMRYFDNVLKPVEFGGTRNDTLAAHGRQAFRRSANVLSDHLRGRDYLLGAEFSGADILIRHCCFMAKHTALIDDHPALQSYHARLAERPAHQCAYTNPVDEGPIR